MFNRDVDNIDSNFRSAEQGIKFQESMEEVYHISVSFSEVSCFFFFLTNVWHVETAMN